MAARSIHYEELKNYYRDKKLRPVGVGTYYYKNNSVYFKDNWWAINFKNNSNYLPDNYYIVFKNDRQFIQYYTKNATYLIYPDEIKNYD